MNERELEKKLRGAPCRACGWETLYWDHHGHIWCASCEAWCGHVTLVTEEQFALPFDPVMTID